MTDASYAPLWAAFVLVGGTIAAQMIAQRGEWKRRERQHKEDKEREAERHDFELLRQREKIDYERKAKVKDKFEAMFLEEGIIAYAKAVKELQSVILPSYSGPVEDDDDRNARLRANLTAIQTSGKNAASRLSVLNPTAPFNHYLMDILLARMEAEKKTGLESTYVAMSWFYRVDETLNELRRTIVDYQPAMQYPLKNAIGDSELQKHIEAFEVAVTKKFIQEDYDKYEVISNIGKALEKQRTTNNPED